MISGLTSLPSPLIPLTPFPIFFSPFLSHLKPESLKSHSFEVKALGQHSNDFNTLQVQFFEVHAC